MVISRLRRLERQRELQEQQSSSRYVIELIRCGHLQLEHVKLAAALGSLEARKLFSEQDIPNLVIETPIRSDALVANAKSVFRKLNRTTAIRFAVAVALTTRITYRSSNRTDSFDLLVRYKYEQDERLLRQLKRGLKLNSQNRVLNWAIRTVCERNYPRCVAKTLQQGCLSSRFRQSLDSRLISIRNSIKSEFSEDMTGLKLFDLAKS